MKGIGKILVFCLAAITMFLFNAEKHSFKPEMMYLILVSSFIVFIDAERQSLNKEEGSRPFLGAGSLGWGLLTLIFLPLVFVYLFLRLKYTQINKQINPSKGIKIISSTIIIISSLILLLTIYSPQEARVKLGYWYAYYTFCYLAYFISAINILLLRGWARNVIIIVSYFSIVATLIVSLRDMQVDIRLLGLLYEAFMIYFFTRPKVKEQFK